MPALAAISRTTLRLLAAVVLLAASASTASASCGDYVHVLPAGLSVGEPSTDRPLPVSPCSQGRCEKAPAPTTPSPAPAGASGGQVLEAVLASVDAIQPTRAAFGTDSDSQLPCRFPSAIFHPPRS
jgi:hypothetical protein